MRARYTKIFAKFSNLASTEPLFLFKKCVRWYTEILPENLHSYSKTCAGFGWTLIHIFMFFTCVIYVNVDLLCQKYEKIILSPSLLGKCIDRRFLLGYPYVPGFLSSQISVHRKLSCLCRYRNPIKHKRWFFYIVF